MSKEDSAIGLPGIESKFTSIEGNRIHYTIAGKGDPILLIHGFPTSSYLWRNIIIELSDQFHVIAIDLPGYGQSDKRIEDSYSFRYYNRILSGFLDQLDIESITLGVHDVGGPIGLYWMVQNMGRVDRLILFNTLVYPKFSWAVKLFGLATVIPGVRSWLTSADGIRWAMRLGVHNKDKLTQEIIKNYQSPFVDKQSRKVLLKSVQRLSLKGFKEIEEKLHSFKGPIQIIFGENDKILPKVASTMKRVQQNLPQADIVALPKTGHFLQEDDPGRISEIIRTFMTNQQH